MRQKDLSKKASIENLKRAEVDFEMVLSDIESCMQTIANRDEVRLDPDIRKWVVGAWSSIGALYSSERTIIKMLFNAIRSDVKASTDSERTIDRETLEWCHRFVNAADRGAQEAKKSLVSHLETTTKLLNPSKEWIKELQIKDKAILRKLACTHWDVVDTYLGNKNNSANATGGLPEGDPPSSVNGMLQPFIEKMKNALDGLGWLFTVFISYAHKDNENPHRFLDKLLEECQPALNKRHIELWWDWKQPVCGMCKACSKWWHTGIRKAREWSPVLKKHISKVDVAVILVSKNLIASSFCMNNELPEFKRRHDNHEGMRVFPIFLEDGEDRMGKAKMGARKRMDYDWLYKIQGAVGCQRDVARMIADLVQEVSNPDTILPLE